MRVGWNPGMPKEFHDTSMQENSYLKLYFKMDWELLWWSFEQNNHVILAGVCKCCWSMPVCTSEASEAVCICWQSSTSTCGLNYRVHHASPVFQIIIIIGPSQCSVTLKSSANVQCPFHAHSATHICQLPLRYTIQWGECDIIGVMLGNRKPHTTK